MQCYVPYFYQSMGLNIIVYKIVEKTMEEGWHNNLVPYYKVERQDWFDSLRLSGDKDFVTENEFVAYDENDEEGRDYVRPKDFSKCREWINENVIESNRQRLLKALDFFEKDKDLVFLWSW